MLIEEWEKQRQQKQPPQKQQSAATATAIDEDDGSSKKRAAPQEEEDDKQERRRRKEEKRAKAAAPTADSLTEDPVYKRLAKLAQVSRASDLCMIRAHLGVGWVYDASYHLSTDPNTNLLKKKKNTRPWGSHRPSTRA